MSDANGVPGPSAVAHLYADPLHAQAAIEALEGAGVEPGSISVVSHARNEAEQLEQATAASDDLEDATERRHGLYDFVEWLGRVESFVVPSFAGVMGTGNLWNDIAPAATERGALTGALVGLGIAADDAERFEEAVHQGQVLVVVHREQVDLSADQLDVLLNTPGK